MLIFKFLWGEATIAVLRKEGFAASTEEGYVSLLRAKRWGTTSGESRGVQGDSKELTFFGWAHPLFDHCSIIPINYFSFTSRAPEDNPKGVGSCYSLNTHIDTQDEQQNQ